ncbi:unnamed protein product, partial [Rotaria sordida]
MVARPMDIIFDSNSQVTLTTLDLGYSHIGRHGAKYLVDALQNNQTLTTLCLRYNELEAVGTEYIADLLRNNTTLITLDIGDNRIKSQGAKYLADALRTNKVPFIPIYSVLYASTRTDTDTHGTRCQAEQPGRRRSATSHRCPQNQH